MLNRKLEAATLTIMIGFFLVPFVTEDWRSDYFMIGFIFTCYVTPVLLLLGLPISILISTKIRRTHLMGIIHALAGISTAILCGLVLGFSTIDAMIIFIGFLYSVLFWAVDQILMKTRFYKRENGVAV